MDCSVEEVISSDPLHLAKGISNEQKLSSITYDEIASKLLNERLLLTALELHAELCEVDRELPILRDFFSNPNNFECLNIKPEPFMPMPRSSSQATLDSLDMTRFSEDGGGVDERVAILEFELRKAKENISSLRANLTVVTESDTCSADKGSEKSAQLEHPIKPHEQRALNYLVNEYLLASSYKLTAITFSDENDNQDFEDWDDVGLNIPKPPELHFIYREYMRGIGYDKPPQNTVATQTEDEGDKKGDGDLEKITIELDELKQKHILLEEEKNILQQQVMNTNLGNNANNPPEESEPNQNLNSSSTSPDKFEMLETPTQDVSNATQENDEDDSASIVVSLGETETSERDWTRIHYPNKVVAEDSPSALNTPSRNLPPKFRKEIIKNCIVNLSNNSSNIFQDLLKDGLSKDSLPDIIVHILPRIVSNIVLNKRYEVIPLILSTAKVVSSSVEREKLLQLLFNLQKRPQEDDRQIILAGLVSISKLDKEPSDNEEILNLCWEQSQHKYYERRLLATECCSVLAIYTSSSIRNSLMVSMLQQMLLDDKEPIVRSAVVKSLALLVALMDDPDKYFQCEELALTALEDVSLDVVEVAVNIFVPILAQWALSLKRFQTHLLTRIIGKLKNLLKPHSPNKDYIDSNKITALFDVLQILIPHTIISIIDCEVVHNKMLESTTPQLPLEYSSLCSSPIVNPRVFYDCGVDVGILLNTFFLNTWEDDAWAEYNWLSEKLIPDIVEISQIANSAHESIVKKLLTYLQSLCLAFGKDITRGKFLSAFTPNINQLEKEIMEITSNQKCKNSTIIPAYLAILSTLDATEFINSIKHFLVVLAMNGADVNGFRIAVVKFCAQEGLQEAVLTGLWEGVINQRPNVRCTTANLFSSIISSVSDRLIDIRIAPAVVTLASDPDASVKAASIPVLGKLINDGTSREAKDKARLTLETMVKEYQSLPTSVVVTLIITLAAVAPNCPQNYNEDVIATHLIKITSSALQQNRKFDLNDALLEAYSVLAYCSVSKNCIVNTILPGLKYLSSLVEQTPNQKESVQSLIEELEVKTDMQKMERSTSASSGLSLTMASVNVGQGVEDMKQRVTKIFQSKANSPGISSIFRKK